MAARGGVHSAHNWRSSSGVTENRNKAGVSGVEDTLCVVVV